MAKGPIVEAIIAAVYQKHPKWKAPEVRNEVSHLLRKDNPQIPSGWPSLSSVQKVLATVRKNMREIPLDPRDKPWSTASMAQYPIPAEALPSILELWVWTRENLNSKLTIRQAQWAARFYTVAKDTQDLSGFVRGHTLLEVTCELIGKPFEDSHIIDLVMFTLMTGQEISPERQKKILELPDEQWLIVQEAGKLLDEEDYTHLGTPPKELFTAINYLNKAEGKRGIK
jgi:hypothetical protein